MSLRWVVLCNKSDKIPIYTHQEMLLPHVLMSSDVKFLGLIMNESIVQKFAKAFPEFLFSKPSLRFCELQFEGIIFGRVLPEFINE